MSEGIGEIRIRLLDDQDRDAVARLAELDSTSVPLGRLLGASIDGRLVLAHSLATGRQIGDPFVRTSELRTLVGERARQLKGGHRGRARRLFGRRSGAALPDSPPDGAGRLLTLPQRAT